jgi:hypothetical protein
MQKQYADTEVSPAATILLTSWVKVPNPAGPRTAAPQHDDNGC